MPAAPASRHLLLFDGECGFCDRMTRFVLKRDRQDAFRFAPLQGPAGRAWVARFGEDPDRLDTFRVVVGYEGPEPRLLSRGRAGLFVLRELGGVWTLGRALGVLPTRLLDWGYGVVARNRHRLARHDACRLPTPAERAKFLD